MIYIDQKGGSDDAGTGSAEAPYQSLAQAILSHGQSSTFSIRVDSSADYGTPTPTALKKAKKEAEIRERKAKKAKEQEAREQEAGTLEKERTERKVEASKAIVLREDRSLPKPIKVG
jgi:asparaginyl-tRNA synthetase